MMIKSCLVVAFVLLGQLCGYAADLSIYLDADYTGARASTRAIEQGILTALDEVSGVVSGYRVQVVIKNHRGNTRRSTQHLREYLDDPQAIAVFAGLHSPPLLANRDFINQQEILLLVPWAAAGPITRYAAGPNWIFRLSVDDTKAGYVIAKHAVDTGRVMRPALLLEHTGWGKSNERTMRAALEKYGIKPPAVFWFNWGVSPAAARIIIRNIIAEEADSILLVANTPEGQVFAQVIANLPAEQRLPVYSHWGIVGGDFATDLGPQVLAQLELSFLQTTFSFMDMPPDHLGQQVLARAQRLFSSSVQNAADIHAPTGFVHGYDLTRILIAAINQAELSGDILSDRRAVRVALESLQAAVPGLIKTYKRPFTPFTTENIDAHEALSMSDLVMGRFGSQGEIVLLRGVPQGAK